MFMEPKEKITHVIKKITTERMKKGYTFDNMAYELSITPAAYRKIETGETKLTLERLFRISEILRVSLVDLLEIGNDVFQQTNNENATGYQQKIENFYQENKEVYEKLLQSKDDQIALLKSMLGKN
jgi:transcriptional regulator with XRE-family HTH domain